MAPRPIRSSPRRRIRSSPRRSTATDEAPLPDHLKPDLRVLFAGINPGLRSAATGHHYAGRGNRFWRLLYDSGLTPEALSAERDAEVLRWGYGLTNLVARPTSGVAGLDAADFAAGRLELLEKIRTFRPAVVALVGLTVFEHLRATTARARRAPGGRVGLQRQSLHEARVFVLPNPSGRNTHFTYVEMLQLYRRLSRLLAASAHDARRAPQRSGERTTLPLRSRSGVRSR